MRVPWIRLKGIGPTFPGEVYVDFDALPGTVTAVCGPNGSGKSMFLGALAALATRELPTRGPVVKLATGADSFIEGGVVCGGKAWRVRHEANAILRKGESDVFDADGKKIYESRLVSRFDAWAKENLPPAHVLEASTFLAQGTGGFLALDPADRRSVLLRCLGVEVLQDRIRGARKRASAASEKLTTAAARVQEVEARATSVPKATLALEQASEALAKAERDATESSAELDAARSERERVSAMNAEGERLRGERATAEAAAERGAREVHGMASRLAEVLDVTGHADVIQAAVARVSTIDAELVGLREKHVAQAAQRDAIAKAVAGHRAEAAKAKQSRERLVAQRGIAIRREEERAKLLKEAEGVEEAEAAKAEAIAAVARADDALQELHERAAKGASARIDGLRGGLRTIADNGAGCDLLEGYRQVARRTLFDDDEAAEAIARLPMEIPEAQRRIAEARAARDEADRRATSKRLAATRAAAQGDSAEIVAELDALIAEANREIASNEDAARTQDAALYAASQALSEVTASGVALKEERAKLAPDAAREQELAGATALRAAIEVQLRAAEAEFSNARARLDGLPLPSPVLPLPDVDGQAARAAAAQRALSSATTAHAIAERAATEARATADRISALQAERDAIAERLGDWTRMASDLDGIMQAEVDSAGPRLTKITNHLLQSCVGTRWKVEIQTLRASADGKKDIEGFEILIHDAEHGHIVTGKSLSGGEAVLVGEAISGALIILACGRYGIEGATIVRDETGAALDPVNAEAYVAIQRLVGAETGASRILLVSHTPAVWDLADSRLLVGNGTIREWSGARREAAA